MITSAPRSARIRVTSGPAHPIEKSATRSPVSGSPGAASAAAEVSSGLAPPPVSTTRIGERGAVRRRPSASISPIRPRGPKIGWSSSISASGTTAIGTRILRPSAAHSSAGRVRRRASITGSISSTRSPRSWMVASPGSVAHSGSSSISQKPAHCAGVSTVMPSHLPSAQRWDETGQVGKKRFTPRRSHLRS